MQAFTEITPPTAVTHAIAAPLLSAKSINLIVAKTSLLQVFEIRTVTGRPSDVQVNGDNVHENHPTFDLPTSHLTGPHQKLVLIGEFPVAGTITSLASAKVPNTRSGGDALLVSFKSAKVSIVEWDPLAHAISTISIHYFEDGDDQACPWMPNVSNYPSNLTVDPRSVCAALKYGRRSLAILPFHHVSGDAAAEDTDVIMDDDDDLRLRRKTSRAADSAAEKRILPTRPSYTLFTTSLDPSLLDPIDMAFLYEYREPTLGVLSASSTPSDALAAERDGSLTFTIFTIDVEDRARTKLLSIGGLPHDIFKLIPMPLPIGGVLLIGCNEVIHVDQSGKAYAVAVNEFATQHTSFPMNDQSTLGLKLEESVIQRMSYNLSSLLIVQRTGELATLSFKMEGRTLAGMSVKRVPTDRGGDCMGGAASCAATVGLNTVFVGSEQADALLLECHSSMPEMARKRSHADMLGLDEQDMEGIEDLEDEDDLYGGDSAHKKQATGPNVSDETPADISFQTQDILPNYASLSEAVVANRRHGEEAKNSNSLELVLPTGCGDGGALTFLSQSISTTASHRLELERPATRVFTLLAFQGTPQDGIERAKIDEVTSQVTQKLLLVDHSIENDTGASSVWNVTIDGTVAIQDTDFERDVETIFAGTLAGGTRIVQVTPTEIRTYDQALNMAEIHPMTDEEAGTEYSIKHASFADPFLLVIRDDANAVLFKVDENGELQELDKGDKIQDDSWTSGCLHPWASDESEATLYLLSEKGALHLYALPDLNTPIYIAEDLRNLPPILTTSPASRRGAMAEPLAEILMADLGTEDVYSPFLFVRTEGNDVEIYEPFSGAARADNKALNAEHLRWIRRPCSLVGSFWGAADPEMNAVSSDERLPSTLTSLRNLNGYRTVFMPKPYPAMVFKEPSSYPKAIRLEDNDLSSMASWNSTTPPHEIVAVGKHGEVHFRRLPTSTRFGDIGWAARRLHLGEEVEHVVYHATADRYVIGTSHAVNFTLPDDEAAHHAWVKEDIDFRPEATHGTIKLLDPVSWTVVDEYSLNHPTEQILCMIAGNFEVSEHTHERRMLIAVGTTVTRGEDLPAVGCVYIFDVIRVAADPARPGTELALKLLVREEVRGAVTGLCEAGEQGLLMIAMGQKLNVRGLTEAGTLLPAAFMDVQEHVMLLKNLKGTGMCLISDAFKGLWFVGFQAEPFKMNLFGKTRTELPIAAAEFLPDDKQLMIVVADMESNIHMFEYNPESPASLSGQRLLHRGAIHSGHDIVSMKLLPCAPPSTFISTASLTNGDTHMTNGDSEHGTQNQNPLPSNQVLVTHTTGALSLIQPLSEASYRRLTALQAYLSSSLDTPCAMNSRSYRTVDPSLISYKGAIQEGSAVGAAGGTRTVVDGALAARWREPGVRGRHDAWGRVGGFLSQAQPEIVAGVKDVEIMRGAGLTFM